MKAGHKTKRVVLVGLAALFAASCLVHVARRAEASGDGPVVTDELAALIDSALYARAEFFGSQARVPYPTAEARNRLAALAERRPKEPRVLLGLARLEEKLGRYERAGALMGEFAAASGESFEALEALAAFQHGRALFEQEAATLERMLGAAPAGGREAVLERLVRLAEAQRLEKYLRPEFFERVISEHSSDFEIVKGYVERLSEKKDTAAALEAVRRHARLFPSRRRYFLEKEVALLDAAGRAREAEAVYRAAFDPFWPSDLSDNFYSFLREHDRFRAYGTELREAFRRDPSDFDTAVRLFHFREHAYEGTAGILARLERARAERGTAWEPDELATAARMLIAEGDGDSAARFLYTLAARGQLGKGSPARARVLYQLFELLSDAGDERLALTRGDLRFYRDVASSDPHPGIVGGVLSLILSDKNPSRELEKQDKAAVRFFNRAAAFRVFQAYREENPTSPELAQMYLDLVRLYTGANEPETASAALAEFERRYADAPEYAEVALRLADCYVLLGRHEDERALYRRVLDHLGRRRKAGSPLVPVAPHADAPEPTEVSPSIINYPPPPSPGIGVVEEKKKHYYYYSLGGSYRDFMAPPEESQDEAGPAGEDDYERPRPARVTYADVLARSVASLAKENRTEEVLALYAAELKKYPDEQGLYEQLLQWLGQTNLFEEQLRVYKEALARFPGVTWRDRLARWLLRRDRRKEFEDFSRGLIAKLDDEEAGAFLEKFIASRAGADPASYNENLYLGLYARAHERFPQNLRLVRGLLKFYAAHRREPEYRSLLAEYYFVSPEIREEFLAHLAEKGELRGRLADARERLKAAGDAGPAFAPLPYKLFRADAAARLSNYEEAVDAYRELNRLYPSTPEFAERLIAFTRSLGQHNRHLLEESAAAARSLADARPAEAPLRTRAGEVFAELGDYERARAEWSQLVSLAPGDPEAYLDAATVYWDYFQYADALDTIGRLRRESGHTTARAFEAGAILEAQRRLPEAVAEYVGALEENAEGRARAGRRLSVLYKRPGVAAHVAAAYARQRPRAGTGLALGYASLLKEVGKRDEASRLLATEVAESKDAAFVERARQEFEDDEAWERACLVRLTQISEGPRNRISYSLRLAASFARKGETRPAANVLEGLVRQFPSNYGVLREAASFYGRLGLAEESLRVLRDGAARGRGRYRRDFSRQLASRLLELNRADEARRVLENLQTEDPLDLGVFRELARVHVRGADAAALKASFSKTLTAVRSTDADVKEVRRQVAELRRALIDAFTQMRDYRAAMEQHVEIVNRDPADEEAVESAIAYARRYGGAEELLAYYQKLAGQAYKNYRWDVVLARIYEAKGDAASSARSYRRAIGNQPEMVELHAALAEVLAGAGRYAEAAAAFGRAAELSNDDQQYVRRTAEVLEKAGRATEAAAVRRRLPFKEEPKREAARDLFASAERGLSADRAKALEEFRRAFDALSSDPYKHDLRASEIDGYTRAVSEVEGLDRVFQRLWDFRERLLADAARSDNTDAGRARAVLAVLDGALPNAVGSQAAEKATGEELARLRQNLREKIENAPPDSDAQGTASLLQNLSRRAGFTDLEELTLVRQKDAARAASPSMFRERLRALVNFYAAAGQYARALSLLEAERAADPAREGFDYAGLTAEYARLSGDAARELAALRSHYDAPRTAPAAQADPLVERYFELLCDSGPQGLEELRRRAHEPTPYSIQLVNHLISKGERELAHAAVAASQLPAPRKLARQAQLSLALGEFDARGEGYFNEALKPATIGELLERRGAANEEGARLEADYGRWLYLAGGLAGGEERRRRARAALPAVVEWRPRDAAAQAELGRWYLAEGDALAALEHLSLALEHEPANEQVIADLGSAHFRLGRRREAEGLWARLIGAEQLSADSCLLYLKTLSGHGLAAEARGRLLAPLAKHLREAADTYDAETNVGELTPLLKALSASFDDTAAGEAGRVAFFRKLCEAAPADAALPRLVVGAELVARARFGEFYELVVARSGGLESYEYDYQFREFARAAFGAADVEEAFDHSNEFKAEEPDAERVKAQQEFLEYLFAEKRDAEAARLAASVEDQLGRRYARPAWLRLARARLWLRAGNVDAAVAELKRFAGADVSGDLRQVSAPSAERLSEAAALLRAEGHEREVSGLLEAAYTQSVALGQYRSSYFAGLARLAFERGDAGRGAKLLRLLVALSDGEAAAEAAALPGVAERFAALARAELPEQSNDIARAEALKLAAETAGSFARYEEAVLFRAELLAAQPVDYANRVELARLLAAAGRREDGAAHLGAVINDRAAPRAARWQAVWASEEVAGGVAAVWDSLAEGKADGETRAALKARRLWGEGRAAEAADLLKASADVGASPLFEYFRGLLELEAGRASDAARSFEAAFRSQAGAEISNAFGSDEEPALYKLIRLHAEADRPLAALKLAALDAELLKESAGEGESAFARRDAKGFETLEERAAARRRRSTTELLAKLSAAAESVGDFGKALEFERARLGRLGAEAERAEVAERIASLERLQRGKADAPRPRFLFDGTLVAHS